MPYSTVPGALSGTNWRAASRVTGGGVCSSAGIGVVGGAGLAGAGTEGGTGAACCRGGLGVGAGGGAGVDGRAASVGGGEGRASFSFVVPSSSSFTLIAVSAGTIGLIDEIHHRPATSSTWRKTASASAVAEKPSRWVAGVWRAASVTIRQFTPSCAPSRPLSRHGQAGRLTGDIWTLPAG